MQIPYFVCQDHSTLYYWGCGPATYVPIVVKFLNYPRHYNISTGERNYGYNQLLYKEKVGKIFSKNKYNMQMLKRMFDHIIIIFIEYIMDSLINTVNHSFNLHIFIECLL